MRFVKEWYEKESNQWVLQFEVTEEENARLLEIEKETGMTISEMVGWYCDRIIKNPELARKELNAWTREQSLPDWLPMITVEELQDHIEDDNFYRVYGNPVVVMRDNRPDCVVVSIEYAIKWFDGFKEALEEAKKKQEEQHDKG